MEAKLKITEHNFNLLFDSFIKELRSIHGESIFNSWYNSLKYEAEDDLSVTLSVRSEFIKEWLIVNSYDELKDLIKNFKPKIVNLELIVREKSQEILKIEEANNVNDFDSNKKSNDNQDLFSSNLDPRLTFENFTTGDENKLASMAIQSILRKNSISTEINIIYLYSKVGLGKSHLLTALAHEISKTNASYTFLTSERFSYYYTKSVANKDLMNFKEKIYDLDYFLLDDIQFLEGKNGTQQEIINLINHLLTNNKKLIFIGDRKLNDFHNLDDKLKSLLNGGIISSISAPGKSLRKKIIDHKVAVNNYKIERDIIEFLASQYFSNVREIEGAINKIIIHQDVLGEKVTKENISDIIKDFIAKKNNLIIDPEYLIKIISSHFKISVSEIKSKKRNKEIVFARDIAIFLSKKLTKLSLSDIGKHYSRDHATILHAYRKIEKLNKVDLILKYEIEKIEELIHNHS